MIKIKWMMKKYLLFINIFFKNLRFIYNYYILIVESLKIIFNNFRSKNTYKELQVFLILNNDI